jgi:hypothetical protein
VGRTPKFYAYRYKNDRLQAIGFESAAHHYVNAAFYEFELDARVAKCVKLFDVCDKEARQLYTWNLKVIFDFIQSVIILTLC